MRQGRTDHALLPPEPEPPWGGFAGWLLAPAFDRVPVDSDARKELTRAHNQGRVVHVLRSRRVLDPAYILHVLDKLGLPRPTWMHDHFASLLPPTSEEMVRAVERREPALLFLRKPKTLTNPDTSYEENFVAELVALQRRTREPIFLIPESLLAGRRASGVQKTIIDVIFGNREAPGELREVVGFLLRRKHARFHVGVPVNLQSVIEREQGQSNQIIAKKVRWSILNHLAREEAIRTGPMYRPPARARQAVLNDPAVQSMFFEASEEQRRELEARGEKIVKRMAADLRIGWITVLDAIIERVWSKIYDGIIVDRDGIRRVWRTARRGPIVLVPSHKSHVDYLVLSQVFFRDGLVPPHIAAGDNLSFWPLGPIFRRSGAFFIRRSFRGDQLYSTICAAYIKRLLREGNAVEFFIEGGRSRTGKLLTPKMGMLSMCADPVFDGALDDVHFIPVSISYEKVIEARAYTHELEGGQKVKEDVAGLLSTRKVLRSRSRFGRVYIDFDEPISMRAFSAARGASIQPKDEISETEAIDRRALVHHLGHRIVFGINQATRITPTGLAALVLLSIESRGIGEADLFDRASDLLDFAKSLDARLSHSLEPKTLRAAIRESLGRLAQDNLILMLPSSHGATVYRVPDAGRRALDFYKNNTIQLFVPFAIIATCALALEADAPILRRQDLFEDARRLSQILKVEFSFRAGFDTAFETTVRRMVAEGMLLEGDEETYRLVRRRRPRLELLAGMLTVTLEAYRFAAHEVAAMQTGTIRELETRLLKEGKRMVGRGEIRRAEAVSKVTFGNATEWLVSQGLLERSGSQFALGTHGRAGLRSFASELSRYIHHTSNGAGNHSATGASSVE